MRWAARLVGVGILILGPGLCPASPSPEPPPLPNVPFFGHLTTADGLPEETVRCLLQDRVGFLWFGTQNGLARYDGTEMRVFRPVAGDSASIGGRAIFALHEDPEGCIWAATATGGLSRLDPRTGSFTNYSATSPGPRTLPGRSVLGLASTADSTLWVALQDGGLAFKPHRSDTFTRVATPIGAASPQHGDSLTALLAARDGTIFVGVAGGGIGRYQPATRAWGYDPPRAGDRTAPQPGLITHILQDGAGRIWFASAHGLALWNATTRTLQWNRPAEAATDEWAHYMTRLAEDGNGKLWIASAVGLYRFDPETASFRLFRHEPRRDGSIAPGPVMSVLCDRSGVVWTGGWQSGVSFLDPWRTRFEVLTHQDDDAGSLDQDAVVSVLEGADGTLWAGTGGVTGVHETGRLNRRLPGATSFTPIALEGSPRTVLALCEDASGALWIGTDQDLQWLPRGAAAAKRPEVPGADITPLSRASVYALELDHAGALWVATFGRGLFRLDPAHRNLTHWVHDPADPQSLSQNRIARLHCDRAGRMWIGTSTAGLNVYEPQTGKLRRCVEPASGLGTITDFEDAPDGGVYVATASGLYVLGPDAAAAPRLDTQCGLADVAVASLVRDPSGALWIHTVQGLLRCGPQNTEVQSYDSYFGVPGGQIYFGAARGRSQLYFGSKHGLLCVDPNTIRRDPMTPPVVITGLVVNDVPAGPETRGAAGHVFPFVARVVLPFDRNDLRFSFAALQLAQPERVRYRYRLQHDDRAWRTPTSPGVANYTNVQPGAYDFEVQVRTPAGDWSPTAASLHVVITPPWWKTLWARLGYVLIASGFAAYIYRLIVQRERIRTALEVQRAEARYLQDLDQVKSRFFANISHEFRTPLTLILGPLARLRDAASGEPRNALDMIQRNARRLGELIEQLLDLSRLEAGRLTVRWQRRDALVWLRSLVSSFDSLASDRDIRLETTIASQPLEVWFEPDLLEKIVVNLLSNAFKFTPPGGLVHVAAELGAPLVVQVARGVDHDPPRQPMAARRLCITVANTGSYIAPESRDRIFERFHQLPEGVAAGGTGIGLALTKELVELLEGRIEVESDPERGTRFELELPVYESSPVAVPEPAVEPSADAAGFEHDSTPTQILPDAIALADDDAPASASDAPGRPRLLVVEDNADLRAFLTSELQDLYEILPASDGIQGLEIATEELPDLVLSDVIMPGLDGIELCRRLKSDERTDHIPVVLLSARTEVESRLAGLGSGADDYQAKPFDPRELRLRVHNMIEDRRRLHERYARQVVQFGSAAMPVTSAEERFLKRACEIIDAHIDDAQFSVEQLAQEIGMSKAQLLRKVRAVTGAAPRDLIRSHRLQRAAHLLANGYGNVTEVAYAVGMESLSTFAKRFREQYGVAPSEYAATLTRAPTVPS